MRVARCIVHTNGNGMVGRHMQTAHRFIVERNNFNFFFQPNRFVVCVCFTFCSLHLVARKLCCNDDGHHYGSTQNIFFYFDIHFFFLLFFHLNPSREYISVLFFFSSQWIKCVRMQRGINVGNEIQMQSALVVCQFSFR